MSTDMTWRKAIEKVLNGSSTPLHYNEITERIISAGLRKNLGATPARSVNAEISTSMKREGNSSPFIRISKGTFSLRPEAVEWIATPKLLGQQQIGAIPVDFNKQLGIYLLYDGREVIYVGRSTDRPLGRRLYEHTNDRLSARWDRFSWFGLLPVSEKGEIGALPETYPAAKLIPALEAILIEALEPRQNRKRGDDLAAVEYQQKIDPEIEKKKVKATLDAALNKL
ncbi:MAG: HTH domain-containing protein [Zavarzinella sp.]